MLQSVSAKFLPSTDDNQCEVYQLYSFLNSKRKLFSRIKYKLLYFDKIKSGIALSCDRPFILFGALDKRHPKLKAPEPNKFITDSDFVNSVTEHVSVFFINDGSRLFNQTDSKWNELFPNWITFHSNFDNLVGLKISEEVGQRLFPKMILVAKNNSNVKNVKEEYMKLINQEHDRLCKLPDDDFNPDVMLTIYKLKLIMTNLITS